jgi:hypothetical protein
MVRTHAMKHSQRPISVRSDEAPLSFRVIIRLATKHTAFGVVTCFGVGVVVTVFSGIASLFTSHQFEPLLIWKIVGFFFVTCIATLWFASILVGCLIMIPVEICRLIQLFVRTNARNTAPEGRLWDRSLDGPSPS